MGIKRHRPEEIVTKLRQVEVLIGQGMARIDAIREVCITEQTFYRWRKQYGGMGAAQQPRVGSDRGSVELKLESTVKIQPQNSIFRFTHRGNHINTRNSSVTS